MAAASPLLMPGALSTAAAQSEAALKEQEIAMQDLANKIVDLRKAGDTAGLVRLTKELLPDAARLEKALHPRLDAATRAKILEFHAKAPKDDEGLARVFDIKPEQTVVSLSRSTTEELAAYKKGSVAFHEFPGGARDLAKQKVLRPGVMFYEVEFLAPGSSSGKKYHLFYWDGKSFSMLGPVWRVALKDAAAAKAETAD